MGKWVYNIHANQEAQIFSVAYADLVIQRLAVQIASSLGNTNVTCLVHAKLHGIDMSGIKGTLIEGLRSEWVGLSELKRGFLWFGLLALYITNY